MLNRRLLLLFVITSLFALGVIVWYFIFSTPKSAPTLGKPNNILNTIPVPRLSFITNYFSNSSGEDITSGTTTTEVTPITQEILTKIWGKPATGQMFITLPILREIVSTSTLNGTTTKTVRATSTYFMFVDRTTGYLYRTNTETGETHQITNTTLPGIYDAYIFNGGKRILLRYLDADRSTIIGLLATIPSVSDKGSPEALIQMTNLPKNISSVAVSSSGEKLSYLVPNSLGSSIYTITSKGQTLTTTSPFSEWNLSYGGEQLYGTTKASAYVEGETVMLPSFTRVVGDKTGLTSTALDNGVLLHSMWSSSGLLTFITSQLGSTKILSEQTLATKCSHLRKSLIVCAVPKILPQNIEGLPDDWYQGRFMFDDTLSLVDISSNQISTHHLYQFSTSLRDMDVTHITPSKEGDMILFTRKQDGSLWLLRVGLISLVD